MQLVENDLMFVLNLKLQIDEVYFIRQVLSNAKMWDKDLF